MRPGAEVAVLRQEQGQRFEVPVQGRLCWQTEPVFKDGGIDAAEVQFHLQVAIGQVGEARVGAVQARPYSGAGQKHRPGSAVVGPFEPFSATRRPNSLKIITGTRSASLAAVRSSMNARRDAESSSSNGAWSGSWWPWVS